MRQPILVFLFFLSGFCGLSYEILWARLFAEVFGSTVFAISAVLSAFMAGLALGSYAFGRWADGTDSPVGLLIVLFWVFVAIFAPLLTPYTPTEQDYVAQNEGPSRAHPLGTDDLGRDIWSRLIYGARVVLVILPIGEDLYQFDSNTYGDFRNVYVQLEAFDEKDTTVRIDNGIEVVELILKQGQTYFSMGYVDSTPAPAITINSGTTVRSSGPIQVGLITGADSPSEYFQSRFLITLSDLLWGADYVVPIPSSSASGSVARSRLASSFSVQESEAGCGNVDLQEQGGFPR